MEIIKENNAAVEKAVFFLKRGGLVIMPTDTLYGAMVDATNPKAVEKLNKYKKRPTGKPYSIAVCDIKMAQKYALLNDTAKNLYKEFLPGALTIVSRGKHRVARGVESETGTLGIRIPDYPLVIKIIKKLGRPVTATSANESYKKRPYKISDILDEISMRQKKLIDLIIDAGELPRREPSTVIDTTLEEPAILRQGEIKLKKKTKILSRSQEDTQKTAKEILHKYERFIGERPIIFALEGPMGSGKTQFTKGIAKGLGIKEEVISPTYNLILEYETKKNDLKLTHIDTWRMQNSEELKRLGFEKMLSIKNSVFSIEWAEKVVELIKKHSDDAVIIWVKIKYGKKENERLISWGVI